MIDRMPVDTFGKSAGYRWMTEHSTSDASDTSSRPVVMFSMSEEPSPGSKFH